jgi:hypothetical protein
MPDLQSELKKVVKGTGLSLTIRERVWLYAKDHPGYSAQGIAHSIKESNGSVSSCLADLEKMKLVTSTRIRHQRGNRKVVSKTYTVPAHTVYDSLRYNPKKAELGLPQVNMSGKALATYEMPEVTKVEPKMAIDIDSLTLGEAKALYVKLQEYFK